MPSLPLDQPAYVFGVLFLAILLAPLAAERVRAPGIIGLLLAGVLIGPNVLGLVERAGPVEMLGGVGLLYLMFVGGVDLDLDGFRRDVRDSVVFGALTFVIPAVVHVALALAYGLGAAAAVMISAAFTSHTLLTYPLVQRYGIVRNRAVTATLGATLLSTVVALVMLAVAAAAGAGDTGPGFWLGFPVGLVVFMLLTIWGLPRLTRWFFRGVGQDRAVRVVYVLVVMFVASAAADVVRIEAIVGAFLAGLGVNRFVGEGSLVRERLSVLGSTLLVPMFLISTGMLVDPVAVAADPRTLGMGLAFTGANVATKFLAAAATARWAGFDRAELGIMVSLSSGQAAGALAAVIVADRLGLVGPEVLNATVLVILLSALIATGLGDRFAPRVTVPARPTTGLGHRIIVPVANPDTAGPLVELAGFVAAADHGAVVALNVLGFEATAAQVEEHREVTAQAESVALRSGAEASSLVRIDASPTAGVLHTVVEQGGTCVLLGWKGYANRRESFFGSVIDAVVGQAPVPVLVAHPGIDDELTRVVLSLTTEDLARAGRAARELAVEVARRIAVQAQVDLVIVSQEPEGALRRTVGADVLDEVTEVRHDPRSPSLALRSMATPGDLVVMGVAPTRGRLGNRAARMGRAVPDRTVLVAVPH